MKPGITAIIIAHNQSTLLSQCLSSISDWVDQIVIMDLESTDDIKSLAKAVNAKYVLHKLVPIVESVRQDSLQYAQHEYVLFLDPDESIPPTLAKALSVELQKSPAFIQIPRQNYIFDKWIKHSLWWPDYQVRLFKKSALSWPTHLHAQPLATGEGVVLAAEATNAIKHLNYISLDEWFDKNKRYAKTEASELIAGGTHFTLATAMHKSVGQIIERFFSGKGYKDGLHGLVLSLLQSFYYFMVYAYYWEAQGYQDLESASTIKSFPRTWFSHGLSETLYWDRPTNLLKNIKAKFVRRMIG